MQQEPCRKLNSMDPLSTGPQPGDLGVTGKDENPLEGQSIAVWWKILLTLKLLLENFIKLFVICILLIIEWNKNYGPANLLPPFFPFQVLTVKVKDLLV